MNQIIYNLENFTSSVLSIFTIHLGSILMIAIALFISLAFKGYFSNSIVNFVKKVLTKANFEVDSNSLTFLIKPLKFLFISTIMFFTIIAQKSITASAPLLVPFMVKLYRIALIITITYFMYSAVPLLVLMFEKYNHPDKPILDNTLIIFFTKIAKAIIAILSFLIVLGEFGLNINGIITGIGLGGLTFALAAQDTASNIFGGLVIISDKPFSVGDWIQTSSTEGIVEDITFRSTRIRTFDDALIVVPNSTLSNASITNWSKMNKRKIKFNVGVTYSTSSETIKGIIADTIEMLKNNEDIIDDSIIVRLDGFGDSALEIIVMFFANQVTLPELKRVRQEVNFGIIDIVHKNGSSFAFPSTSVYIEK